MVKLKRIELLKIIVEVLTGLHIGAGKDTVRIGDIDSPVVKLRYSESEGMPYIPGSSFKGKLRFLAEYMEGKVRENGKVHECSDPNCMICKLFGIGAAQKTEGSWIQLSRLIFRDLELSPQDKDMFKNLQEDPNKEFYEEKIEINIDRISGKATPRYIERVPAGVTFEGQIMLRVFEEDLNGRDEEEYISDVKEYLRKLFDLLNNDYLGGHGSRGYGAVRVRFAEDSYNNED